MLATSLPARRVLDDDTVELEDDDTVNVEDEAYLPMECPKAIKDYFKNSKFNDPVKYPKRITVRSASQDADAFFKELQQEKSLSMTPELTLYNKVNPDARVSTTVQKDLSNQALTYWKEINAIVRIAKGGEPDIVKTVTGVDKKAKQPTAKQYWDALVTFPGNDKAKVKADYDTAYNAFKDAVTHPNGRGVVQARNSYDSLLEKVNSNICGSNALKGFVVDDYTTDAQLKAALDTKKKDILDAEKRLYDIVLAYGPLLTLREDYAYILSIADTTHIPNYQLRVKDSFIVWESQVKLFNNNLV